ncbi:hypothetical protein NE237_026582 [Protea cynaroides]|uniref:Uncharacterized protein n=1 Tax=Protea cynaroides TaxID=273540 RepID=A0A9Q0H6E7_9MAGN|nr:hypothetical protein NE237_026582 [Protea cynaroides]
MFFNLDPLLPNSPCIIRKPASQMESHGLIEDLMPTDVSQVDDCKRFIKEAVSPFGKLDHLVCNAGFGSFCGFEVVDAFLLPPPAKGLERMDKLDGTNRGHYERMPKMIFLAEEAFDGLEKRVEKGASGCRCWPKGPGYRAGTQDGVRSLNNGP